MDVPLNTMLADLDETLRSLLRRELHDVVTKLNARSRSQAVAFAVREGLI